jgi:hypothetical protein
MDMLRMTQRSFSPFFPQSNDGASADGEPLSSMMEKWSRYISKLNEMQTLLYKTGMSAWEKVIAAMNERSADAKHNMGFDEFYNEWSAINESEYVALFNTDEYASLQAELLKLQTEVARMYEKQMEAMLQPFPVVLRSQLEEVYKTNHELRSKINDLERIISEMQNRSNQNTDESNNDMNQQS